jgi:hypothetical protein
VDTGEQLREIALSYAVDHSTISRLKARHAAEMIRSNRGSPFAFVWRILNPLIWSQVRTTENCAVILLKLRAAFRFMVI